MSLPFLSIIQSEGAPIHSFLLKVIWLSYVPGPPCGQPILLFFAHLRHMYLLVGRLVYPHHCLANFLLPEGHPQAVLPPTPCLLNHKFLLGYSLPFICNLDWLVDRLIHTWHVGL